MPGTDEELDPPLQILKEVQKTKKYEQRVVVSLL
jgi:hypothetical protein